MEKTFNWCFIGCGKLAKTVANQLLFSKKHQIVSVYSRSLDKARKFAKKYKAKAYESAYDAILDPNVDGVYIVTPHNAHFRYAKLSLELKKPCLVEKPMTISLEEAIQLKELSIQNQTYIAEAMWTWFCKSAHIVKQIIQNKELGEVLQASIDFSFRVKGFSRLNDPKRAGGSLLDLGVYNLTYWYRLFGYPNKIHCKSVIKNEIDVEDEIVLDYEKFSAKAHSSFISKAKNTYQIICEKGTIVSYGFNWSGLCFIKKGHFIKKIIRHRSSYLNEFNQVAQEIRKGNITSDLVPIDTSIQVMKMMEECLDEIHLVYDCE